MIRSRDRHSRVPLGNPASAQTVSARRFELAPEFLEQVSADGNIQTAEPPGTSICDTQFQSTLARATSSRGCTGFNPRPPRSERATLRAHSIDPNRNIWAIARTPSYLAGHWQRYQSRHGNFGIQSARCDPREPLGRGMDLGVRAVTRYTTSGPSKSAALNRPCSRTSQPRVSGRR